MKKLRKCSFHKKLIIFSLILAVFIFPVFCCCIMKMAEANAASLAAPSCHQPSHQLPSDHPQNSEDCHCEKILIVTEIFKLGNAQTFISFSQIFKKLISPQMALNHLSGIDFPTRAYQAQLGIFLDSLPLYLRNVILRI